MAVRGQNPEAWLARWRQGSCPIHGLGLIDVGGEPLDSDAEAGCVRVHCPHEDCLFQAGRFPGKDRWHNLFGWVDGSQEIHAALLKANDIDEEGKPTRWAKQARTAYRLEEDDG